MLDFSGKLEQLYPNTRWYGPYTGLFGRKYVVCRETREGKAVKSGKSFSMSFARAKVQANLGRILTVTEEVDHIDGNCTNDELDNLQVLSTGEHRSKTAQEVSLKCNKRTTEECPCCSKNFVCGPFRKRIAEEKGRHPCCSRKCSSTMYAHG